MPLLDIQVANAEIGRVRIGIKQKAQTERGEIAYPAKLDRFRLTSSNRSVLEDCARVYGGEVREWEGHPGEFELITERKHLQVLLSGEHSLTQDYEQWIGGGWTHRCDGQTCTRRGKDGAEWTEPCSCAPIRAEWDRHRAEYQAAMKEWERAGKPRGKQPKLPMVCKPTSRLTFMLTEINSTGKWLFTSGGKIFAQEIAGHFATCEALGLPNFLFCVLTLEEEEIKRPGQPAEKFPVVRVSLDPNPPNFLGRIVQLVKNSQYVLPAGEVAPALGQGAKALEQGAPIEEPQERPQTNGHSGGKRSNAELARAHGLDEVMYAEITQKVKQRLPGKKVGEFLQEAYTDGDIGFAALLRLLAPAEDAAPAAPATDDVQNAEFTVSEPPDPFGDSTGAAQESLL